MVKNIHLSGGGGGREVRDIQMRMTSSVALLVFVSFHPGLELV